MRFLCSKFGRILPALLAVGLAVSSAVAREGVLPEDSWRQDILELVSAVKDTHPAPFQNTSEANFDAAVEELLGRLARLDDKQIVVEMARIVALLQDGHTRLEIPRQHDNLRFSFSHSEPEAPAFEQLRFASLPLAFGVFGDAIHIIGADNAHASLLGAEVVAFGATPSVEARRRLSSVCFNDNRMTDMLLTADRASLPEVLAALGIIESPTRVVLSVKPYLSNETVTVPIEILGPEPVELDAKPDVPVPLWLRDTVSPKWSVTVEGRRARYLKLNLMERDTEANLTTFFRDELSKAEKERVDRIIIDLRHNHGGSAQVQGVVNSIVASPYNRRGKLFVLIGRETFSAAQMLLNELEQYTDALFVGESSGSRPDHFGDPRRVRLSNSGLTFRVSRLHWSSWRSFDGRAATQPHKSVAAGIDDFMMGRDPVLAAALEYAPPTGLAEQIGDVFADGANWDGGAILIKRWLSDPRVQRHDVEALSREVIAVAANHEAAGSHLSALLLYDKARQLDPGRLTAYLGWARTAVALGEPEEARKAYRAALNVFPDNPEIRARLAALPTPTSANDESSQEE